MSKKIVIFIFLIAIFSYFFVTSYTKRANKPPEDTAEKKGENTEELKIDKFYIEAESQNYKVFSSGANGNLTVVLDKKRNLLLVPDETCNKKIPEELKKEEANFYNDEVGITYFSPYKSLYYKEGTVDTFRQSVLNAGCTSEEGEITLTTIQTPAGSNKLNCKVDIFYKFRTC